MPTKIEIASASATGTKALHAACQDCERFLLLHLKSTAVRNDLHGEIITEVSVVCRGLCILCRVMDGCPVPDLSNQYRLDGTAWWKGPDAEAEAWRRAGKTAHGAATAHLAPDLDVIEASKHAE